MIYSQVKWAEELTFVALFFLPQGGGLESICNDLGPLLTLPSSQFYFLSSLSRMHDDFIDFIFPSVVVLLQCFFKYVWVI